jgi:hypothetical protein
VDIGYYGRYYDAIQERVEFTGLFRDASDAGKFKIFSGLVDEPTNVVNTTGTGYTVATLVANVDGNLNGTANAANILSTARTIAASGDATWSVSFDGSANVTSALTLANTGVTATTYGTSTAVPTIAVDSKGRITSASNTNITFPVTTVNGFAGTVVLTTSDVAEGTNQYFTTARAQASITGGASSVVTANLTASRALVSDGSGKIAASATTTTTEIGYLAGVTSAIQTQLNGKLNLTGGTLTGGLIGTTGSFSSSGSGDTFTIGHTSGSGIALNITKNGNGEGLYINKASGSGNAATIVGNLGGTTASFSGLLSGTSATFSSTLGVTGALSGTSATFSGNLTIDTNTLFVDSVNNNVGIGTSSNIFGKLSVEAPGNHITMRAPAATAGKYWALDVSSANQFYVVNNAGTQYFTMTDGGNFGIGTPSPSARLHVANSAGGVVGFFQSTATNGEATISIQGRNSSAVVREAVFKYDNADVFRIGTSSNIGLRFETNDVVRLTIANTGAATFSSSVNMGGDLALTPTDSAITFSSGAGRFFTGGSERMRILSNGRLLVGTTTDYGYKTTILDSLNGLFVRVESESSGATPFLIQNNNSGGTNLFEVKGHGFIKLSVFTYNNTTSNAANLFVNTDGGLYRSTASTSRVKDNIVDWSGNGLDTILALKPRTFNYKADYYSHPEVEMLGLIAEEVAEVSPYLAEYENQDRTGQVENVKYATIVVPLIKAVQELKAEIEELKALIAAK